jgi:hypothetical protein
MAQKTSWNGAALTESDINTYLMGEGGAWTTWTPTLTQSGTVTATVTSAVYGRWGRLIVGQFRLSVTGSGTGSNAVTVSLPVTSARTSVPVGSGGIYDVSAVLNYTGNVSLNTTTTLGFEPQGVGVSANLLGATGSGFTAALASGDIIQAFFVYEAAS